MFLNRTENRVLQSKFRALFEFLRAGSCGARVGKFNRPERNGLRWNGKIVYGHRKRRAAVKVHVLFCFIRPTVHAHPYS